MNSLKKWTFVLALVSDTFAPGAGAKRNYGEDEPSHKCGGGIYNLTMTYSVSANQLLNDMIMGMPTHGYDYTSSHEMSANCYRYGAREGSLVSLEYKNYLTDAVAKVLDECKWRLEGRIELAQCRMGYQYYPITK